MNVSNSLQPESKENSDDENYVIVFCDFKLIHSLYSFHSDFLVCFYSKSFVFDCPVVKYEQRSTKKRNSVDSHK